MFSSLFFSSPSSPLFFSLALREKEKEEEREEGTKPIEREGM
jgi:hypothetical protein